MTFIIERGVILNSFVVEGNQMLCCGVRYLSLHPPLELLYRFLNGGYVHLLDGILCDFGLEDHALLLELLADSDSLPPQVLLDHCDTVIAVLIHEHAENPRLPVLHATPVHRDLVVRCQTVVDLLERGQMAPRLQLGNVLYLRVRLQHQEDVLSYYEVNVDHLFADFTCLLAFLSQLQFDFLLTWKYATVTIA